MGERQSDSQPQADSEDGYFGPVSEESMSKPFDPRKVATFVVSAQWAQFVRTGLNPGEASIRETVVRSQDYDALFALYRNLVKEYNELVTA
jgi:hypothetical protein